MCSADRLPLKLHWIQQGDGCALNLSRIGGVARWMQQLLAEELCVDRPPAGSPQQLPDSVGNLARMKDSLHHLLQQKHLMYSLRKQRPRTVRGGKRRTVHRSAHAVKRRVKYIEKQYDDCGEDVLSLMGEDQAPDTVD